MALAKAEKGLAHRNATLRAARWYRQAVSSLDGLARLSVEQKLESISSEQPDAVHGWVVIFRSADPAIWNTNNNQGINRYAIDQSHFPKDAHYLKLSAGANRAVIIPVSADQLAKENHSSRFSWNGAANNEYGGRHLGICDTEVNLAGNWDKNVVHVYCNDKKGYKGWGFGHKPHADDKQYFAWDHKEIDSTVFEISVKVDPLNAEEAKLLLK